MLCPAVCTPSSHSWPVLIFAPPRPPHTLPPQDQRRSGGQQPICEDTWLSTGGEISFTRAAVIWTVTNEASLVTRTDEQPRAGLGSVAPLLMTPTVALSLQLMPWHVFNALLIARRFSGHKHVSFCLLIKLRFMQSPAASSCWLFRNTGFPWPDASLASTQRRVMNGP